MSANQLNTSVTLTETIPKIHIRFFGSITAIVKKNNDDLDYSPDTTVSGLLCQLSEKHGKELQDELFDEKGEGGLRDDLMITVNDAIINHEKAYEIEMKPGDVIALYPTFPGGG